MSEKLNGTSPGANPAPLGLLAFGMTTVLLNLANSGFIALSSMIMAMGIFVGGIAQVIAGILEFKKNNSFGMTAFCSYGLFWLSLVAIWTLPHLAGVRPADDTSMGFYLLIWGLYTSLMFIGALKQTKALQFVFLSLSILFFLLAIADFSGSRVIKTIAGIEGIICGLSAVYASMATLLNEVYGKTILPVGQPG